jgi:hypothetical protein
MRRKGSHEGILMQATPDLKMCPQGWFSRCRCNEFVGVVLRRPESIVNGISAPQ